MKQCILSLIESENVRIHFLDGTAKTLSAPIKSDSSTDETSITLSDGDKDYFINLNSVAYVTKSVVAKAIIWYFSQ